MHKSVNALGRFSFGVIQTTLKCDGTGACITHVKGVSAPQCAADCVLTPQGETAVHANGHYSVTGKCVAGNNFPRVLQHLLERTAQMLAYRDDLPSLFGLIYEIESDVGKSVFSLRCTKKPS